MKDLLNLPPTFNDWLSRVRFEQPHCVIEVRAIGDAIHFGAFGCSQPLRRIRLFANHPLNEFFRVPRHMTRALKVVITENSKCILRATREQFEGLHAMHQLAPKALGNHLRKTQIGVAA